MSLTLRQARRCADDPSHGSVVQLGYDSASLENVRLDEVAGSCWSQGGSEGRVKGFSNTGLNCIIPSCQFREDQYISWSPMSLDNRIRIALIGSLLMIVSVPHRAVAQSWQDDIRWAQNNKTGPDLVNCPDQYGGRRLNCLTNGGRWCLMNMARDEAAKGQCNMAFEETLVTQCHNGAAQTRLRNAGQDPVCEFLAPRTKKPETGSGGSGQPGEGSGDQYIQSAKVEGSAVVVRARNTSNGGYHCSVHFTLSYVDAEGNPATEDKTGTFDIPKNYSGIVFQYTTDYAASTLRALGDIKPSCSTVF